MKLSVDRSYIVSAEADMPLRGQYIAVDSPKRSIRTAQIDGKTFFLLSGESHQAGLESDTQVHYKRLYTDLKELFSLSHLDTRLVRTRPTDARFDSVCRNYLFQYALCLFEYGLSKMGIIKFDGKRKDYQ